MARNTMDSYSPTEKGMEILQAVCAYGGLTALQTSHLLQYTFRYEKGDLAPHRSCGTLLLELSTHGYLLVDRRKVLMGAGRKAYFYTLSSKGRHLLAERQDCKTSELECRAPDKNLEHFILVNDFRSNLLRATRDLGLSAQLVQTDEEAILRVRHARAPLTVTFQNSKLWSQELIQENTTLIPDYYFHLSATEPERGNYRRFVEIDRGMEALKHWELKVRRYREYTKRDGWCTAQYGTNSVAILSVTTTDERLANIKRVTEDCDGRNRFWFTTFDRLNAVTFFTGKIWAVAGKVGLCGFFDNPKDMESSLQ